MSLQHGQLGPRIPPSQFAPQSIHHQGGELRGGRGIQLRFLEMDLRPNKEEIKWALGIRGPFSAAECVAEL